MHARVYAHTHLTELMTHWERKIFFRLYYSSVFVNITPLFSSFLHFTKMTWQRSTNCKSSRNHSTLLSVCCQLCLVRHFIRNRTQHVSVWGNKKGKFEGRAARFIKDSQTALLKSYRAMRVNTACTLDSVTASAGRFLPRQCVQINLSTMFG